MVSELICLDVIRALHGPSVRMAPPPGTDHQEVHESTYENALDPSDLYKLLLGRYELSVLDAAVRWLELTGYLGRVTYRLYDLVFLKLTSKGAETAQTGQFPQADRDLLYTENPYAVFIAHQFSQDDEPMAEHLKTGVLEPAGYEPCDGRADGLEEFRTAIIRKMRDSRFFVCLLTKRDKLVCGRYVSSLWLYQEIGAAVALGKQPLLLVEDEMAPHSAGGLTDIYEFIPFARSTHAQDFERVVARLNADLERSLTPLPSRPAQPGDASA